jgi:hypothetical protein
MFLGVTVPRAVLADRPPKSPSWNHLHISLLLSMESEPHSDLTARFLCYSEEEEN